MNSISARRAARFIPAAVVIMLGAVLPASAFAQATRTWVSGTGDDANPCSRTAPCKTFAGAFTKTATGGEINAIDSGGYGAITITRSITIDGAATLAGVLVAGGNGIVVNAGSAAHVTLRNLDINGLGGGTNGVNIISASVVRIEDSKIYGFTMDGVLDQNSGAVSRLVVQDSTIHDNVGAGVHDVPPANAVARATLRHDAIDDNGDGVIADGNAGRAAANIYSTSIADNGLFSGTTGFGVHAVYANGVIRLGRDDISGNVTGIQGDAQGFISSFGDNDVGGNNTDISTNGTVVHSTPRT